MKKSITFLAGLFLFSIGCSTLEKVESLVQKTDPPVWEEFKEDPKVDVRTPAKDEKDYKARVQGKKKPFYAFRKIEWNDATVSSEAKSLFIRSLKGIWKSSQGKYIEISDSSNPELEYKSGDVDGVVDIVCRQENDSFFFENKLMDPINQISFGSFIVKGKILEKQSPQDQEKRLEFYKDKNFFRIIPVKNTSGIQITDQPTLQELDGILMNSISGRITVHSTSEDTMAVIDNGVPVKLPLKEFPIGDGVHEMHLIKSGQESEVKKFSVRAGSKLAFFHEWKDDLALGALRLLSFPPGLVVSWDKQNKGETPYYTNDLPPQKYSIEASRRDENGTAEVVAEGVVNLEPKKVVTVSVPWRMNEGFSQETSEFWKKAGSGRITAVLDGGMVFKKQKEVDGGWFGFESTPIFPGRLEALLTLFSTEETGNGIVGFGIHLDAISYFLEFQGKRVSVYKFPSDGIAQSNWNYVREDKEKGRPVKVMTYTEDKKNKLRVLVGNTKVLDTDIEFSGLWKFSILTHGKSPALQKTGRSFSLRYTDVTWKDGPAKKE